MEERWLPQDAALSTSGRRLLLRSSGHLVVIFDKCLSLISLAVPQPPCQKQLEEGEIYFGSQFGGPQSLTARKAW